MIFGSVCSGIEAASVAWKLLGWRPAFVAEVDPFPSVVLACHHPEAPNLGDFTTIERSPEPVRLLVGGTPCQDFSVAGLRAGLDGERGNLTLEFLRLAGRLRPDWLVWENVPGVLSVDGGRAFGAFLGGLGQLGYGFAYRVLDAQHFGVPQRRRRVFVVGNLGDWRRAAAVLFERDSLSGNPPPGREARPGISPSVTPGARRASGNRSGELLTLGKQVACPITSRDGQRVPTASDFNLIAHTLRADGFDASEDGTGRGTPLVVAYQCHGSNVGPMGTIRAGNGNTAGGVPFSINAAGSCAVQSHARESEIARCLDSTGSFASAQGGTVVVRRSAVRRLTPRECERLQGFPDDYTLVDYRGKPAADGPRYKALGNSMAVPCMAWLGRRIDMVDSV